MDEEQTLRLEELNAARRQDEIEAELAREAGLDDAESDATEVGADTAPASASSVIVLLGFAKDGFDLVMAALGIGLIPFVGQIPGMLFTVFLIYYQWSHGMFSGGSLVKKALSIGASLLDNVPGIHLLPLSGVAMWISRNVISRTA